MVGPDEDSPSSQNICPARSASRSYSFILCLFLQLKCCGADGPGDWATSRFNNVDRTNIVEIAVSSINVFYNIPESCCKEDLKDNECELSRRLKFGGPLNTAIYQQGCVDKMIEIIYENWVSIFAITIAVILLELLSLTFALSLCCAVRNQHYKA
ncbi:tetraspanin-17-like [Drosophila guanche]|uniref:tetraspanin-17-like n=1 Tax=Drosophila guanche TaxID=7266 RepID=UPI00147212AE|nr:tetraspanin-17-like [Drosophila guanche]